MSRGAAPDGLASDADQGLLFPLEACSQGPKAAPEGKGQAAARGGKRRIAEQLVLEADGFPFRRQQTPPADDGQELALLDDAEPGVRAMNSVVATPHADTPPPATTRRRGGRTDGSATIHLPPDELRSVIVTFGDAIRVLDQLTDVTASTKAAWRSAASSFARKQQTDLDHIRLDPIEMRSRIEATLVMTGKGAGRKRLANLRSALNTLAMRMGWVTAYGGPNAIPVTDPDWLGLLEKIPHTPQKSNLAGFARFCESRGWKPEDVAPDALEAYRSWRLSHTYDTSVAATVSAVRATWNRAAQRDQDWPRTIFEAPRNPRHFRAPLEEFHPDLLAELEAFRQDIQRPDPFEDHARRAVSETTAKFYVDGLLWGITALAQTSGDLANYRSLSQIVTAENLRIILKARHAASGEKWCPMARSITSAFRDLSRRRLSLPVAEQESIEHLAKKVKQKTGRLSERRTDDTLAIVADPRLLKNFMKLPWAIAKAAEELLAAGRPMRAAELSEMAVAIGLLLQSPLRRRAIVRLDASQHFARDGKGRVCAFKVPRELSKTGVRIDHEIDGRTARLLERHLKLFRPALVLNPQDTALFPSRVAGKARSFVGFAARMKKTVERQLGARFYIHLVRHVVAATLLSDNPHNGPIAQRMLGHSTVETTEGIYGHLGTKGVHHAYADSMERQLKRAEIRLKGKPK
jgi:integrase